MATIQKVLTLHSSIDSNLRDEVLFLCSLNDAKECQKVFLNIRKTLFQTSESRKIQELCISKGIDTQIEYSLLRMEIQELPEDPRPQNTSWYDYLHPFHSRVRSFVKSVLNDNNIRTAHEYDEWRNIQSSERKLCLPTIQNINDGYFGDEYSDFNTILNMPV